MPTQRVAQRRRRFLAEATTVAVWLEVARASPGATVAVTVHVAGEVTITIE
jgi:hypothetical protein